jgi:transcriptional regulator with XRE-family HTH domain
VSGILKVCGQNIRWHRKKKGLTLGQISNSLGITGAYLGYLERGQRNLSLLTLAKISDVLEISPHILLRDSQDEFNEAMHELEYLLVNFNEVKYVNFLKEVIESYLKLRDNN